MNRILSLTTALTTGMALAFFATVAHAATTTGMVVSTDASTNVLTIRTEAGQNFSFDKNDATTFDLAGTAAEFGDLLPGVQITVTSDQAPSDPDVRLLATHVQIDKVVAEAPMAIAANDEPAVRTADRLPATATPLPLVMLAALVSIVAGIGLRVRRS